MDRYDLVIRDIQEQTRDGALRWKSVSPSKYQNLSFRAGRVIRAYRTDYTLGEQEYELVFLDQRVSRFDEEAGWANEKRAFEVLILGTDGEIVLRLYEGAVDGDDLSRLAGLIETRDDRVTGFFSAFERARGIGSSGD